MVVNVEVKDFEIDFALARACTFLRPRRIFSSVKGDHDHDSKHSHSLARGSMPREAEISLNERDFIKQALQEQIRLDNRAFDAFRKLELTFGEEYGVADVQLGKTRLESSVVFTLCSLTVSRVIARISIDVTTPLPERKFDGVFQIVTEFSPMASPAFEVGRYITL